MANSPLLWLHKGCCLNHPKRIISGTQWPPHGCYTWALRVCKMSAVWRKSTPWRMQVCGFAHLKRRIPYRAVLRSPNSSTSGLSPSTKPTKEPNPSNRTAKNRQGKKQGYINIYKICCVSTALHAQMLPTAPKNWAKSRPGMALIIVVFAAPRGLMTPTSNLRFSPEQADELPGWILCIHTCMHKTDTYNTSFWSTYLCRHIYN